ncbi:MAG: twin-arginine translocation signal domain-containing protein [Coriobacteriia bacterium]|nr:twin-arginine translocation signal domain-containing protein [Coriobacteriia bacterium]
MGKFDKDEGVKQGLSRRDFLKTGAAAAAVAAAGADFAARPSAAGAAPVAETYHTTCPYCSASCGQLIDVDALDTGNVLDLYGDNQSPFNDGGLCSKGAGTFQLVTNERRLGAWPGTHPTNNMFAYDAAAQYADGIAYKHDGDNVWYKVPLQEAMDQIAVKMKSARDANGAAPSADNGYNSKQIAFFGSSHLNNEQNYSYRRLIAQFGTSNVEHQARI